MRSLYPTFNDLMAELSELDCNFDEICCTESWLNDSTKDLIKMDGYLPFHCLREHGRRGGGVSVLVLRKYRTKLLPQCTLSLSLSLSLDFFESVLLNFHAGYILYC